ncbi:site-specific integrase [Alicyclobacillus sp. SO9]|uniref:tyrosine-type recombinase/integrase n=1 Tax=Alicyclobacillus sp. SO9 TaxID=2665646 RepID=UPI0018E8E988|nr:site-specific integrase [Alicyclobacillus sp. SO9]QQE77307.1 site-specific integrase [Alicyclobacillus sp. SO9]
MSLMQLQRLSISNEERLRDWIWTEYLENLPDWTRDTLSQLEPVAAFRESERVRPILILVSDLLEIQLSQLSPCHLAESRVTDMLSGNVALRDKKALMRLLVKSQFPNSTAIAQGISIAVATRQIHFHTQLPQAFREYLQMLATNGRSKGTVYEVRNKLGHFIRWTRGKEIDLDKGTFSKIRPGHIAGYMEYLRRLIALGAMSRQSAALRGKLILSVFEYFSDKYGVSNLGRGIATPKRPEEFVRWIPSEQQVERFFGAILEYSPTVNRDMGLFGLMYLMGLRPSETERINKTDLRLELNEVSIIEKGGDAAIVFIPQPLLPWLEALADSTAEGERLFRIDSKAIRNDERNLLFRLYAQIANWPVIHGPGVFRHAFCTHALRSGISLLDVSRFARHEDMRSTTHYIHLSNHEYRDKNQGASTRLLKEVDIDANFA